MIQKGPKFSNSSDWLSEIRSYSSDHIQNKRNDTKGRECSEAQEGWSTLQYGICVACMPVGRGFRGPIAGCVVGATALCSQINPGWERRNLREDEGCCSSPDVENREVFLIYVLSVTMNQIKIAWVFPKVLKISRKKKVPAFSGTFCWLQNNCILETLLGIVKMTSWTLRPLCDDGCCDSNTQYGQNQWAAPASFIVVQKYGPFLANVWVRLFFWFCFAFKPPWQNPSR